MQRRSARICLNPFYFRERLFQQKLVLETLLKRLNPFYFRERLFPRDRLKPSVKSCLNPFYFRERLFPTTVKITMFTASYKQICLSHRRAYQPILFLLVILLDYCQ